MQAMKIASDSAPTTIGELQQYLNELEAAWSLQDIQYIGEFKEQTLHGTTGMGVCSAKYQLHAEHGLIAIHTMPD